MLFRDIAFEQEQELPVRHNLNYPLLCVKTFFLFYLITLRIPSRIDTIRYCAETDSNSSVITF